jgi:pyruvate kinase
MYTNNLRQTTSFTELPPNKTRIVATIGPASNTPKVLARLIRSGMNIARLNFSHGDFGFHRETIEKIRAASVETCRPVAIMADLPGPKMRIGEIEPGPVNLKPGDTFTLTTNQVKGDASRVSVNFTQLPKVVKVGDPLSLNDGYVQLVASAIDGNDIECVVRVGGELSSHKGLNVPGIDLGISAFTERDRECLEFALAHGVEAVSQSFVEGPADVRAVREAARLLGHDPFVIAKIERSRALDRIDEILEEADGIMIARGDLGIEVPIERIAVVQKDIMRRANQRARPVITATQMLESMTHQNLPTRAEATDVSNAILDGTDAVMLSAESAVGAFPVESVAMLVRIAAEVETIRRQLSIRELHAGVDLAGRMLPLHLIAVGVEASLEYLKPAAVFARTETGVSARRLSGFHLPVWTVAVTTKAKAAQDLLYSSGVVPVLLPKAPASWNDFIKDWVRQHQLPGSFAILTDRPSPENPKANHRMEIIDL